MLTKQTHAETLVKTINKIRASEKAEKAALFDPDNNIVNGYITLNDEVIEFEPKELLDGGITMHMPKEFELMEEAAAKIKYPEGVPEYIYTNEDGTVNIVFNTEDEPVIQKEIENLKNTAQKKMAEIFIESEIVESDTLEASGNKIPYFIMNVKRIDSELQNFIYFILVKGKLITGSVNYNVKKQKEWVLLTKQMLYSITWK